VFEPRITRIQQINLESGRQEKHEKTFLKSAICNRHSAILGAGGIAQLVERQLCKLEVRGSNPLASSPENFRGCRAEALAKADRFLPCHINAASYDSAGGSTAFGSLPNGFSRKSKR
jgi:hypothetical protein